MPTRHVCPAQFCEREYTLTQNGKIRRHPSRRTPDESCPGSGHPPKDSEAGVIEREDQTVSEWDRVLSQGVKDGRLDDVEKARATYESAAEGFAAPDSLSVPEGVTAKEFDARAERWLSKSLIARREEKGEALTVAEIANLRRRRYQAILDEIAMDGPQATPPVEPAERGPWFEANYPGDCSQCSSRFFDGDEIRADGEGDWQGRNCCGHIDDAAQPQGAPTAAEFMGAPSGHDLPLLPVPPWATAPPVPTAPTPTPPWVTPPMAAAPTPPSAAEFMSSAPPAPKKAEKQPETELGAQITARFKEIFFSYVNRDSADNRGAQTHLGPSGIGNSCDRRIALELMRVPACNPGDDSWASWVGTQVHRGLAEMFEWANHGTGRFATEVGLEFPVVLMPRGTTDLIDRTLMLVLDHKIQGAPSAADLKAYGPAEYYQVQAHTYGYGARLKGEEIEQVAITSWPRDRASLNNLYTWTAPYDESVALKAIARVEKISERITSIEPGPGIPALLEIGRLFPTANSCKYCPFHAAGDRLGERGCQGYDR